MKATNSSALLPAIKRNFSEMDSRPTLFPVTTLHKIRYPPLRNTQDK